jgi:hypothetical protein
VNDAFPRNRSRTEIVVRRAHVDDASRYSIACGLDIDHGGTSTI